MSIQRITGIILTLLVSNGLFAQRKDFGSWTYINAQFKYSERISFGFTEHALRFENATEWWMFLHDFSINQKISKHISQEFHFRLGNYSQLNDHFTKRSIFYYTLNGSWSKKQFSFSMRSRWQAQAYEDHWNDSFKGPYYYHRLKLGLAYHFNYHYKISFSEELFQPLNRPNRNFIDQHRSSLMISFRKNKYYSVDCFYQIQEQIGRANPHLYFMLGTGLNITL
jgi:hypothetical protein